MRIVKLNEAATILGGYAFSSYQYVQNKIPLIRISNITNDSIVEIDNEISIEGNIKYDKYIIKNQDILIALSGATTGKFGIFRKNIPAYLNQRVGLIRSKSGVYQKYLFYVINVIKNEVLRKAGGAAQPNISTKKLGELKIPLPDIPTQKAISARLDQAEAVKNYNQALLAKYDQLGQAIFLEMFGDPVKNEKGWEVERLGEICDVGSSKRVFTKELKETGIPFYRGTEIRQLSDNPNINPTLYISKEHYEQLKKDRGVPKVGDLLLPSICSDGSIFEVRDNNPFYFKDGRVLWIGVNERINSTYLKNHLKQIFIANYSKIASGTTFSELKIFRLKEVDVLLPPLNLQTAFARRIENIERQKAVLRQEIEKSEELFNSLLQESFRVEEEAGANTL